MATLAKQIAKYLHPVVKARGYVKTHHYWQKTTGDRRYIVEFSSFMAGPHRWYIGIEFGVFSLPVEEIFRHHLVFECAIDEMPGGVPVCHFGGQIEQFDEDASIVRNGSPLYIPIEADLSEVFPKIAQRFARTLSRFEEKYSNLEFLAGLGRSGDADAVPALNYATACLLLGRYDEVEPRIAAVLRKNDSTVAVEGAARIRAELARRQKSAEDRPASA